MGSVPSPRVVFRNNIDLCSRVCLCVRISLSISLSVSLIAPGAPVPKAALTQFASICVYWGIPEMDDGSTFITALDLFGP